MLYSLGLGDLKITATDVGAELISVKFKCEERVWQNMDGSWAGHAPVLFPVCGACAVVADGKDYNCPKHGFARKSKFHLCEKTDYSIKFSLTQSDESKKVYPYNFMFFVEYRISGDKLYIKYEVYNPQESDIYFSCGGHDSFLLKSDLNNYELLFEKSENFVNWLTDGSLLSGKSVSICEGNVLDLGTELLSSNNSICLKNLQSRKVTLREKSGTSVAEVCFPQSDKLVLWHPHNSKMLCIEPWQNLPDIICINKEFKDKDGVIKVAPHEVANISRSIKYF